MNQIARIAIGALCALLSGAAFAQGQSSDIFTSNAYRDKTVWITIYDLGKTRHLDYGCVNPNGNRAWASGNYLFGSFYYVRGEVYDGNDCKGTKVCDTTVQVNPQANLSPGIDRLNEARPYNTSWEIRPNGNNCYWEKTSRYEVNTGFRIVANPNSGPAMCTGRSSMASAVKGMKVEGSYTKTCRNCYDTEPGCFAGLCDSLQAECETSNRQWTKTTLKDVSKCKPGTIWNDNGQLKCER